MLVFPWRLVTEGKRWFSGPKSFRATASEWSSRILTFIFLNSTGPYDLGNLDNNGTPVIVNYFRMPIVSHVFFAAQIPVRLHKLGLYRNDSVMKPRFCLGFDTCKHRKEFESPLRLSRLVFWTTAGCPSCYFLQTGITILPEKYIQVFPFRRELTAP